MKRIIKILSSSITILAVLTGCSSFSNNEPEKTTEDKQLAQNKDSDEYVLKQINGTWGGVLKDGTDLSIYVDSSEKNIYLNSTKEKCENYKLDSKFEDNKICFCIPRKGLKLIIELQLDNDEKLNGTCRYLDKYEDISFTKKSNKFTLGEVQTAEFHNSYMQLQSLINENSNYKEDNLEYKFNYDVDDSYNKSKEVLKDYDLDSVINGKKDVDLMKTLLVWECSILNHNSQGYPDGEYDLESLINYGKENGLNCRGLSEILSEVLKMYGIKAQVICCIPYTDVAMDGHVVVNAYSEELNQWIMLDPTYCLILQDETGKYIDVRNLRNSIANNSKVIMNEEAAYNEDKMTDLALKDYLCYMAKNSCCYTKRGKINDKECEIMLVSDGYQEVGDYSNEYGVVITTDDKKFWE